MENKENKENTENTEKKMNIKHLVISGGGPILIQNLASIQYLAKNECIQISNIESIYGTSAGALLGVFICLKFDWEVLEDYLIKRPWHEVFEIKINNILDVYTKKGLFDIKTIEKIMKPLFDAKDISLQITLREFYELSNIRLHFITFDINEYKTENISYLNYPDLSLLMAIQMTCCIPILVSPVCIENKCFIDGGILCNYPLNYCIESGALPDEILGLKNLFLNQKSVINNDSNIVNFLLYFLYKYVFSANTDDKQPNIKYEIYCNTSQISLEFFHKAANNMDMRRELFDTGLKNAVLFLKELF